MRINTRKFKKYIDLINSSLNFSINANNEMSKIQKDILCSGGKRIRAILSFLGCEVVGSDYYNALPIAVAYEMAHTAALIQDDFIDDADIRRGVQTVWKKYGIKKAILIADTMIFDVFLQLEKYSKKIDYEQFIKLLSIIGNSGKATSLGEFLDIEIGKKNKVTIEDYLEMVKLKTGYLLSAPIECGAVVGEGEDYEINLLKNFAINVGIAYQIKDDLLDIVGRREKIGKPIFTDIKNHKKNAIIIHALNNSNKHENKFIKSLLGKNLKKNEIDKLRSIFEKNGSIEFARKYSLKISNDARNYLNPLKNNSAKELLKEISFIAVERYA